MAKRTTYIAQCKQTKVGHNLRVTTDRADAERAIAGHVARIDCKHEHVVVTL